MNRYTFLLILITLSCFFGGCTNQPIHQAVVQKVKIGVIAPLSGPASTYGIDGVNAYMHVVNQYNHTTTGTIIELIIEDGKCDGKASTDAAQKLISIDQVQLIMVVSCSSSSLAAGKVAQDNSITSVHSLSVAPALSSLGSYVFRYPNGKDVGQKMGQYANTHWKTVHIVTEKTEFPKALKEAILKTYTGTILFDYSFDGAEKDFSLLAQQLSQQRADGLFVITQSDATSLSVINALAKEELLSVYSGNIMGFATFGLPPFLEQAGILSEGLLQYNFGAMYALPAIGSGFLDKFTNTYPIHSDPGFVVLFAESMDLVADAVSSGTTTSDGFKEYFTAVDKNNKRTGLFGSYYFDSNGDVVSVPFHLQKITNGSVQFVE